MAVTESLMTAAVPINGSGQMVDGLVKSVGGVQSQWDTSNSV